ncbi:MAG: hypothetical protein OER80_01190 [Gammaproteobacteria bacterium]|nr:hypothetical protein [Gammaproteobacteria bacterium]MDH3768086.1 hypothetical protein [Gammaproteobacteria bacterium]
MDNETRATGLISRYGFVRASGVDAGAFLQSQFSADIAALDGEQTVLTGWHDPKGRVICCIKVVRKQSGFWMVLPSALIDSVISGLKRYIFRSRVDLLDISDQLAAAGVLSGDDGRYEVYAPASELATRVARHHDEGIRKLTEAEWELGDIRAGLPEVYPASSGMFTGQMLNLDLIGGISFTKGCYPGQEIIARSHHLGRVKRRMQRYVSAGPARVAGEDLRNNDGRRAGQVVRSAASESGSESLVVTNIENPITLVAQDGVTLEPASLPYLLAPARD